MEYTPRLNIRSRADAGAAPVDDFEVAFVRLQVAIERACWVEQVGATEPDWPAQVAAAIHAAFRWAARDPAATGTLVNEALAVGRDRITRHRRLVTYLAQHLHRGREEQPERSHLPDFSECALAGGLIFLVARRLEQGCEDELPALAPEAIQFVLTPYLGVAEARRYAYGERGSPRRTSGKPDGARRRGDPRGGMPA